VRAEFRGHGNLFRGHKMMYDEGEHVKEVFAYFGRAIYAASCVETGLVHALLYLDYLSSVEAEIRRTKGKGFDRQKYEANFDAFMEHHFAQTLGNLIKKVNSVANMDKELKDRIATAKKRRDFLVHHYWRERAEEFATRDGRAKMIDELNADGDTFELLDEDVNRAMKPARQAVGISDEVLKAYTDKFIERVKSAGSSK
jgi:hypothetical protein